MRYRDPRKFPRRLLACVSALLLLAYAFSFSAFAAAGYSSYTALTAGVEPVECVPISEIGSEEDIADDTWIGIDSAENLILLSQLINGKSTVGSIKANWWRSSNRKYRMTASITFTEEQSTRFEPIASGFSKFDASNYSLTSFLGTFDGCGYMIEGLQCPTTKGTGTATKTISYTSLFGLVGAGATIRNLVIGKDCSFTAGEALAKSCTASIASRVMANAQLINLLNFAPVTGGVYAGGLVARIETTDDSKAVLMSSCTNLGAVSGNSFAGGLAGTVQGSVNFVNCVNRGSVTSGKYAGGLFGAGKRGEAGVWNVRITMQDLTQKGSTVTGDVAAGSFFGQLSDPDYLSLTGVSGCSSRSIGLSFAGEANGVELPEGASVTVLEEDLDETLTPGFHGLQLGNYADGKLDLRFVGSIAPDPDAYSEIGYRIVYQSGNTTSDEKKCVCKKVFTSLLAGSGDGMVPYRTEQLRAEDGYLYALTLTGVPVGEGRTVTFTVRSYAVKADGTELLGKSGTVDLTVTDGQCVAAWRT